MTLEQFNELVNRGYAGGALAVIAGILLLIYLKIDSKKTISKKTKKTP